MRGGIVKILFLDTSSFFVTIAIVENNSILYIYQDEIKDDMSSKIMPIISEAFSKLAFTISDIDKIMVVNGPGSFTGVRIGVTIAKVLSWSLKKDIITISSLEYLATTPFETKYVIPMIDCRRGNVYAGIYDANLNIIKEECFCACESLRDYFDDSTIVSFNDIENSVKPKLDIIKIIIKHINDKPINSHLVNPNYLKKTEAEERLAEKNND